MIKFLLKLPRKTKKALMILFDVLVILGSIFTAFYLRLGDWYYLVGDNNLMLSTFLAPALALPIFYRFELYHTVIRFVGFNALLRINQAATLYAIFWGLITFLIVNWEAFPRSVILINWLLVMITISSSRLFARWLLSETILDNNNVLIYGAGSAGRQLSTALNSAKGYKAIGFIDDSSELNNQSINGLKVYSKDDIRNLIEKKNIKEVLLAIPSLSRIQRRQIINYLEQFAVVVRSLPSLSHLAQGKVKVEDLLEIDIRDLLGRDPVMPNNKLMKINIFNKVVLITGAGGSIGSELCRQILLQKPKKIILYEVSESALYQINQELNEINISEIDILPIIGSISDLKRMKEINSLYEVQTIYHAAAYKHVPLVEFNQSQGVMNNAIGTMIAAKAAISSNVETFVLISTDKAVRPTSVMGATKRVAELVLQALNEEHPNICFTMVRFGNVLDSSGSVIPLFKKQIKAGGPVTVTHPDIVRYFMTIPEAVELVIQAGAIANGGEVFVLDMGEPVRIYDLAEKMIKLSGLQVLDENNSDGDIEIQFTGLRPGEKLYEELLLDGNFSLTENKLIMRTQEDMISWFELEVILNQINEAVINTDTEIIYKLLSKLVPEFNPTSNGFDKTRVS